ncbi:MAG: ribbon-helix-helix protein, CopG family [Candidatus Lokiarchaeota archaeon]|nr:ribbon-helix-helix protein, CopG family [Candidatus Lokiarchaeota archaeon]
MEKEKFLRISVSLPESLLDKFDLLREEIGMSRSDAIRKAMRNFITEYNWAKYKSESLLKAGTISIIFDHTQKTGLMDDLNELQHKFVEIIDAALHIHLDPKNCMLIMAVKGNSEKINRLLKELNSKPEYRQVKQTLLEFEREDSHVHDHGHGHSHIH